MEKKVFLQRDLFLFGKYIQHLNVENRARQHLIFMANWLRLKINEKNGVAWLFSYIKRKPPLLIIDANQAAIVWILVAAYSQKKNGWGSLTHLSPA